MSRIVRAVGLTVRMVPRRLMPGVYRVSAVARALRAILNALVPKGMQEVRVVARPLAGAELGIGVIGYRYVQCYEDAAW